MRPASIPTGDLTVEHARGAGYTELQLYVDADNERARRLYELDGWTATGEPVHAFDADLLRCTRAT